MQVFKALCRWIDGSLATDSGRTVALAIISPLLGVVIVGGWWWALYVPFAVASCAFVLWRAWQLFKTGIIGSEKSDWVEP